MQYDGLLLKLPQEIKWFLIAFVVVLSVGFYSGLLFVNETSTVEPNGIEENYLGNENDTDANIMKFKKSEREMLTVVHTHVLSMSMIFFLLGILVWLTKLPKGLKIFLTLEPFLSVLLTFGGIYLLWSGVLWFKYIVLFSGILMTISFVASTLLVLFQLLTKNTESVNQS